MVKPTTKLKNFQCKFTVRKQQVWWAYKNSCFKCSAPDSIHC